MRTARFCGPRVGCLVQGLVWSLEDMVLRGIFLKGVWSLGGYGP